jgi:hypothetical protein
MKFHSETSSSPLHDLGSGKAQFFIQSLHFYKTNKVKDQNFQTLYVYSSLNYTKAENNQHLALHSKTKKETLLKPNSVHKRRSKLTQTNSNLTA